jgi:hypothetical protein
MEIWLDFEENVVDGHFVFVWPVAADVGQSVIWLCGCEVDGSEAADDVVFVLKAEFEKPDVSLSERFIEFRHGRCHLGAGVDEDTPTLTVRRKLGCTL